MNKNIKKLKENLKGYKADTGGNDYLSGYVDGWLDAKRKSDKK